MGLEAPQDPAHAPPNRHWQPPVTPSHFPAAELTPDSGPLRCPPPPSISCCSPPHILEVSAQVWPDLRGFPAGTPETGPG